MLTSIVSALGEGMNGYARGKKQYDDEQFQQKQRKRQEDAWADEDALKAGMKEAAAPVEVKPGEVYQPEVDDEGNRMPENPTVGTFKAGNQRFTSMAEAQAAAEKANTPEAQAARMADVYAKQARPEQAIQLRNAAKQSKLTDFQLSKAENEHLDDQWNRRLDEAVADAGGVLEGVADMMTRSQVGGLNGRQFYVRDTPDGKKRELVMVDQDGKETVHKSYDNNDKLEAAVRADYMKADPMTKLKLSYERARDNQAQANWQATFEENKRQFGETKALQLQQLQETIRAHKASEGNQAAQLRLLGQQRDLEQSKFDYLKEQDGMSKLAGYDKVAVDSLRKRMDQNNAAIAKAMAEDAWVPVGKDGKPNPLLVQQQELDGRLTAILERYRAKQAGATGADPVPGTTEALGKPTAQPAAANAAPKMSQVAAPQAQAPASTVPAPSMSAVTQPQDNGLLNALTGGSSNQALGSVMAGKAQKLSALASEFKAAQAELAQVAAVPGAANQAATKAQQIRNRIMDEIGPANNADQIIKALGI